MNKNKALGFLYIFIFTTLFLCGFNIALATEEVSSVAGTELLQKIANNAEIVIHRTIDSGGETARRYVLEIKNGVLTSNFNSQDGTIIVDGKEYFLEVNYETNDGRRITISPSDKLVGYDDSSNIRAHVQYLSYQTINPIDSNAKLHYSLIPVDSENSEITLENQTVKVKTNLDGVAEPEIKDVNGYQTPGIGGRFWGLITDTQRELANIFREVICNISIPCADSFLQMICLAMGEPVTIDKAVYNQIGKLSIDFFDGSFSGDEAIEEEDENVFGAGAGKELNTPIKNIMGNLVNKIYGAFRNIAVVFYMVLLVYMGLKILLTSTAEKKANYKAVFSAWVMGIVMLMFFPYVMKYTIELNNALCQWLYTSQGENGKVAETPALVPSLRQGRKLLGNDGFIMMMLGTHDINDINDETMAEFAMENSDTKFQNNVMMEIRFIAAHQYDIPLVVVYFILIGQLLAILILYYKRVFMIAFLIVIFPLVAMIYPLAKIGDVRINAFGTWFKEFLVNVFVQAFHAVTYLVIVTLGVNSYLESQNWLFMIMCILFLFEGEKIIRAIFSVKSGTNSIGDMAAAGAMAMTITKSINKFIPSVGGKDKSATNDANEKAEEDREKAKPTPGTIPTPGAASNMAAATGGAMSAANTGGNTASTATTTSVATTGGTTESTTRKSAGSGTATMSPSASVNDKISGRAGKGRIGKTANVISKTAGAIASGVGQATGATVGFTFGMAQKDVSAGVSGTIAGMNTGKEIGTGAGNILKGAVDKVSSIHAGFVVSKEYAKGEHDDELGIAEADSVLEEEKKQAIRNAYAKLARRTSISSNGAEILFIRETLNRLNEESED